MSREAHVRFWKGAGVRIPRATRLLERLPSGGGSPGRHRVLLPLLQSPAFASESGLPHPGGDLCRVRLTAVTEGDDGGKGASTPAPFPQTPIPRWRK